MYTGNKNNVNHNPLCTPKTTTHSDAQGPQHSLVIIVCEYMYYVYLLSTLATTITMSYIQKYNNLNEV